MSVFPKIIDYLKKKATQLRNSEDFFEIRDYFKKIGTNPQLRDKSVSVSFCPPTEFASARHAGEPFCHPLITIARERAEQFFGEVSVCGPRRNRTAVSSMRMTCSTTRP